MIPMMQEMVGWLYVLVAASGAVLCGMSLARSRWAMLLTGAFATEALIQAFTRLAVVLVRNSGLAASSLGAVFLLASLVSLVARGAVVAGVAGVLSERPQPSSP